MFQPPENELQKVGERVPSEHELRVQRSLQRLNVPDWYKNSQTAKDGFRLKRHSDASQHSGWRALSNKTTSLSSLSSPISNRQPTTGKKKNDRPTKKKTKIMFIVHSLVVVAFCTIIITVHSVCVVPFDTHTTSDYRELNQLT